MQPTLVLLILIGHSLAFSLYDEPNYKGLIWSSGRVAFWSLDPRGCYDIPAPRKLSSVRTTGCMIFYDDIECKGKSFKVNGDVPNIRDLEGESTNENFDNRAASLRYCYSDEGYANVDVELYDETSHMDPTLKFDKVCKCISISKELANFRSIDNHHNCITLYTSSTCSAEDGEMVNIFAGKSSLSENLTSLEIYGNVAAFKPCSIPPNCFKFDIKLYQADIQDNQMKTKMAPSDFFSMSARTIFHNNGSATVLQEYSAKKKVRQVVEVGLVKFDRFFTDWKSTETTEKRASLSTGIQTNYHGVEIEGTIGLELGNAVEATYSDVCDWAELTWENYVHETFVEFSVKEEIEVPPCTIYDVDSFISVRSNYPLSYRLYFQLRGEFDGKQMSAEELIKELVSMEEYTFNHTIDEYTVVAYSSATITATFGVDTEIRGDGYSIRNCLK